MWYITLVLGLNPKSEQLWDILPSIANLHSANAPHSAQIVTNMAGIQTIKAKIGNTNELVNQLEGKVEVLENYHAGKIIWSIKIGKVCFFSDGNFWSAKIQTKILQIFTYLPTNIYDKLFIISHSVFGHWLMQWNRHFLHKSQYFYSVSHDPRDESNEWNYHFPQN